MFAQHEAVVGGHDQGRIVPHVTCIHCIQKPSKLCVAHCHKRGLACHQIRRIVTWLVPAVTRPIPHLLARCWKAGTEFGRGMERLMRIENLELKEPVVVPGVRLQKRQAGIKRSHGREIRRLMDLRSIHRGLKAVARGIGFHLFGMVLRRERFIRRGNARYPRISLLPADEIPTVKGGVIGCAAVLEIVVVVGDQVAMDSRMMHQPRSSHIKRFQRSPRAVQKIQPPGLQVAPGGHTGQRADNVSVELHTACRQTVKIWCRMRPTVAGQGFEGQRIV